METITLQKLMVPVLVKNSPAYYGIQGPLPCSFKSQPRVPVITRQIHSTTSCPIHLKPISISFTHLCQNLPSRPFPVGFPIKRLYEFLVSLRYAAYVYSIHITSYETTFCEPSIVAPLSFSHFVPHITSTPCYQTPLNVCSCLNVRNQVSHPHTTRQQGKRIWESESIKGI